MNLELERILEGALLAAAAPMSPARLAELFDEHERPEVAEIESALARIEQYWQGRGVRLAQVASGYRFQVCDDLATWVNRLWEEKPQRYSRALLETLALIAYRQPITRGDIEEVRGVAVSSQIVRTLLDRDWVRIVGHREVPGRPALYATTRAFLDYFGLKSLDELPTLSELRDLDLPAEPEADRPPADADETDPEPDSQPPAPEPAAPQLPIPPLDDYPAPEASDK